MAERHDAPEKGYEDYQLNIGPILYCTIAVVILSVVSFIAMWAMFQGLEQAKIYLTEAPPPMAANQEPYKGSLIQVIPSAEMAQVRATTQKIMGEYGWVDKDAGVVYMPVDRAVDLALKRGFPVRK